MDGPFWHDTRLPFVVSDAPAITLTTSYQALVPTSYLPVLGANYFNYTGKALRIRMFGRFTTGATPGSFTLGYLWGNNANNTGTSIAANSVNMTANLTGYSWQADLTIRARSLGTGGTIIATGIWYLQNVGFLMMPVTLPGSIALDLTPNNLVSPQMQRSGSTTETVQVHDILFESIN